MANSTIIEVPTDLNDEIALRRFFQSLVDNIDLIKGNHAESGFSTEKDLEAVETQLNDYLPLSGGEVTGAIKYITEPEYDEATLISKQKADSSYTYNEKQDAVAKPGFSTQSFSDDYDKDEIVQLQKDLNAHIEATVALIDRLKKASILS